MLEALISGKLIKAPELKTGQSGKYYCQFLLSVAVGEEKPRYAHLSPTHISEVVERMNKRIKGS